MWAMHGQCYLQILGPTTGEWTQLTGSISAQCSLSQNLQISTNESKSAKDNWINSTWIYKSVMLWSLAKLSLSQQHIWLLFPPIICGDVVKQQYKAGEGGLRERVAGNGAFIPVNMVKSGRNMLIAINFWVVSVAVMLVL